MANFFRLICFGFLALFAFHVNAATVPPIYKWSGQLTGFPYSSAAAGCASMNYGLGSADGPNAFFCVAASGPNAGMVYGSTGRHGTCPVGSIASDEGFGLVCTVDDPPPPDQCVANSEKDAAGNCVCKKGFMQDPSQGKCVPNGKALCETFAAIEGMMGGMRGKESSFAGELAHGAKVCVPGGWGDGIPENQGCRMEFDRTMLAGNPDGSKTSYGSLEMSGGTNSDPKDYSCIAGDGADGASEPPKPPKPECENGSKGTVNGVSVCVPRQKENGVETGGTNTTTTNDGTNTTKKVDDSKTVCVAGKCTTTTTTTTTITNNTTGASTTTTGTNAVETGRDDFCKSNPKNAQCDGTGTKPGSGSGGGNGDGEGEGDGEQSSFGGSCAAGFSCEGDAIQCAIARQQHMRACKLFDDESPESNLYRDNKAKEGNQTKDLEGNETVDMVGRIDQTDLLGGGSGVADLAITVAGVSVTLPFSKVNPYLSALGNLLVAVSMLLAFRIVGRG